MKRLMTGSKAMTRRDFAAQIVCCSVGLAVVATGCGGGGTSSSRSAPSQATRSRVLALHDVAVRNVTQSGFQSQEFAFARNRYSIATPTVAADNGAEASLPPSDSSSAMPLLGAFLRNVAAKSPTTRMVSVRAQSRQKNDSGTAVSPPDIVPPDTNPEPMPSFYFDYYLGLWVQIEEAAGSSTYLLFDDESKSKPAGHITTINPVDWESFPQLFSSEYEFTSGYLAGSHGFSKNVTNADYSGSSQYENVYADGWKDRGTSNWSALGDFSWSSRTDGANGEWNEGAGSFRADGSGGTRLSSSDGYKSDYRYNADGSGHGQITGPDPGLPVSISWDAFGNTTIVYADGSTEHVSGWGGSSGGGGEPIPVDTPVAMAK